MSNAYPITFIVSYRDREEHLEKFVAHYKDIVPKCEIVIVEQLGTEPFKRGHLLNIGFMEASRNKGPQSVYDLCDIDMLAVWGQVDFSFPKDSPAHLATQASQFNYTMPYEGYYSGHVLFTKEQYHRVNGYANAFKFWGAEDDDLRRRVQYAGYEIVNRVPGRFISLEHKKQPWNQECYNRNLELLKAPIDRHDGLNSCRYTVVSTEEKEYYTHIRVEL